MTKHLEYKINYSIALLRRYEKLAKLYDPENGIIVSPIIDWTKKDVWEFLNNVVKVPHCKLYDSGHHRIGCIFCPISNIQALRRDEKEYPHQRQKWIDVIKALRREGFMMNIDEYVNMSQYSEDETTEIIFEWWLSKQNIKDYALNKFSQLQINFDA